MKEFIVEKQKTSPTSGYYAVVVKGETHTNRTVITSDLQFYTTEDGYSHNHPWQIAKFYAEAIAKGLNDAIIRKDYEEKEEMEKQLRENYPLMYEKKSS